MMITGFFHCHFRSGLRKVASKRTLMGVASPIHQQLQSLGQKKFVVVTGGVISGIGKGITASSIGVLMKMMKLRPTAIKIDPYLNIDAGTMSPTEHGEVFVLDDGAETDLDLGNYERFLDVSLTNDSNLTTGKVYQAVIARERNGEYLGKTVQIIPHISNEIIQRILRVSSASVDGSGQEPDVTVIELGGTIGDIESMPFVEAIRQLKLLVRPENFCLVHVSMVPIVGDVGEQKTKPTQHSVKELRSLGLVPDFIVCRSKAPLQQGSREKIALFCNVPLEQVLSIYDVKNIYEVPLLMLQQQVHTLLKQRMKLPALKAEPTTAYEGSAYLHGIHRDRSLHHPSLLDWALLSTRLIAPEHGDATIAMVGKYNNQGDAYLSITSALIHSCIATKQKLNLIAVDSEHLEEEQRIANETIYNNAWDAIRSAQGILVPGGFGSRGIEGKILAAKYAREAKVPYLGICLGMQVAVIEYVRHVLNRPKANSEEFNQDLVDADRAVIFMPEGSREKMGGTMRLGSRKTLLAANSKAKTLYDNQVEVLERHRHRYEVNPDLVKTIEKHGLIFSGRDESNERMEIIELPQDKHPFYMAAQFHPEFKSRPNRPSPLFLGFLDTILAAKLRNQHHNVDEVATPEHSESNSKKKPAAKAKVVTKKLSPASAAK